MSITIFLLSLVILVGGLLFIDTLRDIRWGKYISPIIVIIACIVSFASFFYESIQHMMIAWTHPTYEVIDMSLPDNRGNADLLYTMREQGYIIKWMHRWSNFGCGSEMEYVFIKKQNTVASDDSVKSIYNKLVND